ncbi:MAG: M20/M25/M40 family metallo-hydrolase [Acidobacteriota bacterium]
MRILALLLCWLLAVGIGAQAYQPQVNRDYIDITAKIIGSALVEEKAYDRLSYLCDRIGHRLSGSQQLDQAIEWALTTMKTDGLENVHSEPVMVPHWVRGAESAEVIAPVQHNLSILGLGGTIGTPPEGIAGEVVVVKSYEQLDALGAAVKGKIVLYNVAMRSDIEPGRAYGEAVQYRTNGASRAAKHGAVAMLLRSVTTRSLRTPHTGAMRYAPDVAQIPAAAVTIEDAELIDRLVARGEKVIVQLKLGAKTLPDAKSANVIAEWRGRERPEEIVLICGHLDSWDVGTGATDDGSGCIMAMEAARILAKLNMRPRRTIRVVLFTNEENGLRGAFAYRDAHRQEIDKHIAAIECDAGADRPVGFSFSGTDRAFATIEQIAPLLKGLRADRNTRGGGGADISPLIELGVPGLGLRPQQEHYFDLHHTEADTMDKIDRQALSLNVATLAVMTYMLADLPEPLARQ